MGRFHTFMSHSPTVYARGMQLDFQGILLLMWGSTAPLAYYSFGDTPSWQGDDGNYLHAASSSSSSSSSSSATTMTIYGVATTVLAALCSLATFHPNIGGPRLGHARAVLFAAFGAGSFLVPIVHGVWTYGWAETSRRVGLPWIGLTVACNGFGVLVYAFKVRTVVHVALSSLSPSPFLFLILQERHQPLLCCRNMCNLPPCGALHMSIID